MICVVIALTGEMQSAGAIGIESLVMPGQLVESHKKYEEDCGQCHQPFRKESQTRLCRDCHEKVDADISGKQGFHGRSEAGQTECRHCHTDHKGREADIVALSRETFDHDVTDYPLKGAHDTAGCNACHEPGNKFRDTPDSCVDCHEDDDVHKGRLGEDCVECHSEKTWRITVFDHDSTDFSLGGKHDDIDCNSCHTSQRYEEISTECYSCHRLNDIHAGRYGSNCIECHSDKGWDRIEFDHDKKTDYPLAGKHREVACDACHTGYIYKQKLATECISCHRNDDEHSGRYGEKCDSCHRVQGWDQVKFDHDRGTDFPLRGKHKKARCESCHRGKVENEQLAADCYSCHRPDDVHNGQEGKLCERCHSESGWDQEIRFDHDMAKFPLIGLHATTPCEECHLSATFKEVASDCHTCHRADDVHQKRLGPLCESCHNPNAWALWEFDHNLQTEYSLDGKHAGIDCLACHTYPAPEGISLSSSCADCHHEDDVHDGRFGHYCERCHNTESFDSAEIR